ncbi:MAG: hypothetical protein ACOVP1_01415 [Bacteroidia bacterium]
MDKIRGILVETAEIVSDKINTELPDYKRQYKITSGENFDFCPYLVLDIPQINPQNFGFVFRIFFRWGHHFSAQVIVNADKFEIKKAFLLLSELDLNLYILKGNNPWENRHEHEDYLLLKKLNPIDKTEILRQNWLKLSLEISIKKPENLVNEASGFYEICLDILKLSAK